ncbi:MAG: substrate-binding domain-containing protein, partial [Oscillospiraceae bacterium]
IQGAQKVMSENNQYLTVHFTQYNENNEPEVIDQLIEKGTNGIIVYAWQSNSNVEYYTKLQKSGFPIVFIDKSINSLTSNLVLSDNYEGCYQGVEHLIKKGHKKIMFLSFSFCWGSSLEDRFKGYRQCLQDYGIEFDEEIAIVDVADELCVNEVLNNTLAKRKDVTACMCASDWMAYKLYGWCHDNKLKIPRDISICGFDNNSYSATLYPGLTTIAQDFEAIGTEAANLVLELNESTVKRKKIVVIPTTLVSRDSVNEITE